MKADFVVAMWARGTAGASYGSDLHPAMHAGAYGDIDPRHMCVARGDSISMIDDDDISITEIAACIDHDAVGS